MSTIKFSSRADVVQHLSDIGIEMTPQQADEAAYYMWTRLPHPDTTLTVDEVSETVTAALVYADVIEE